MTAQLSALQGLRAEVLGAPEGALTLAPRDRDEVSTVLRHATTEGLTIQVLGGGTHSGYGNPDPPDVVLSTHRLDRVERWEPDDLTLVAGAGVRVQETEEMLGTRSQTAVLPERPGAATIGGVVSAGVSGWRRSRLYPTRERVLEVTVVTGDGRVVRGGGRVVKNVTGYDLPRLVVGAFGSLGVVVSVCLKLWPTPPASATVTLESADAARLVARPLAVLRDEAAVRVYLWGTEDEVSALAHRMDGQVSPGLHWPEDPDGRFRWSLRVPPALVDDAIGRLPPGWHFVASLGVGEIRAASEELTGAADMRSWAEASGGALVVVSAPQDALDGFDAWGRPPPALDLQRGLIAQFDPARVINPGRLPAGL